ncbi:hypothetical protein [Microcella sp.]|uniref:hypothetical protein n=1 Tax=Microcella sp. TaxID=1913979 RepID=UPI00391B92FA
MDPTEGDDLAARDTEALMAIAFGRPTNEQGRARAREAAAILQERAARRNGPGAADLEPLPPPVAVDEPEREPRWRARRRTTVGLVALLCACTLIGVFIGSAAERWGAAGAGDSLQVFDRTATLEELDMLTRVFGPGREGDARLIHTAESLSLYGVRFLSDSNGGINTGPQICVVALADGFLQTAEQCVPEAVFREQGVTGFFPLVDRGIYPSVLGGFGYTWGPRGDIEVRDLSSSLNASAIYSAQELAQGLDVPSIQALGIARPLANTGLTLHDVELGPIQIGAVGSVALLGTTRMAAGPDAPRIVCLTAMHSRETIADACTPMDQFREEGLRERIEFGGSTFTVDWSPRRGVLVDRSGE